MKERKLKLLENAYDSLYDLNSFMSYQFQELLEELENTAKLMGYNFVLRRNKWKLKREV